MTVFVATDGIPDNLPDVTTFVDSINKLDQLLSPDLLPFFAVEREIFVARAPGRIDLMGGIADYSGAHVLQWPTREAACVALQMTADPTINVASLDAEEHGEPGSFSLALDRLTRQGVPIAYEEARGLFNDAEVPHWASYLMGAFLVLMREKGIVFQHGAHLLVSSDVPWGKGVSSSAAIEVATMYAIEAAYGLPLAAREVAVLCQAVENEVAGSPCGVMDQMTSSCGEEGWLLSLLCQPAELKGTIPLPADLAVWGIDSGIRHAVTGADYGAVRTGAFMGYRIIADLAGLEVSEGKENGLVEVRDPHWGGYLANLTPREFEERFADRLPETVRGEKFLAQYGGTTDTVTKVDPENEYAVRIPTAHPIYENDRVREFLELLTPSAKRESRTRLGQLMYASHASYSACGLGSDGTDSIVEIVQRLGEERGLYGAKITGGGSGGTVAVLADRNAELAVADVVEIYSKQSSYTPHVFSGSSPSASQFGVVIVEHRR